MGSFVRLNNHSDLLKNLHKHLVCYFSFTAQSELFIFSIIPRISGLSSSLLTWTVAANGTFRFGPKTGVVLCFIAILAFVFVQQSNS